MKFEYPREAAPQIHRALSKKRAERTAALSGTPAEVASITTHWDRVEPIPAQQEIEQLLDVAFFASLTQEEGQSVSFSMTYADPNVADESEWPHFAFEQPLPMSVEALRKLGPAASGPEVDLAMYSDRNGALAVWGVLFLRSRRWGGGGMPPGLAISARRPGLLEGTFGAARVFTYANGIVRMRSEGSLDKADLALLIAKFLPASNPLPKRMRAAALMLAMARIPLEAGSGATLLMVPDGHEVTGVGSIKHRARDTSTTHLGKAFDGELAEQAVCASARLALIDGALIVNENAVPTAAGVMISTTADADQVVDIFDPLHREAPPHPIKFNEFVGGARHRSALSFCSANPGAVALVVSHDGVMSIAVRPSTSSPIAVIRPIRLADV